MRYIMCLLACTVLTYVSNCQVLPKEGSILNWRVVGFAVPPEFRTGKCTIEIAKGSYFSVDSFKHNVVKTMAVPAGRTVADVPFFGTPYTWCVVSETRGETSRSKLFHFSTSNSAHVDTGKLRVRVMQATDNYKNSYIAVDGGGVVYDMSGSPVAFVPDTNGVEGYVADMQFTKDSTITLIYQRNAFELTLSGKILWKAPNTGAINGDASKGEIYHHEFTKLSNGHYMALGYELLMCKPVTVGDSSYIIVYKGNIEDAAAVAELIKEGYARGMFGTLVEYDKKGKAVWAWKSSNYLIGSDFDYYTAPEIHERLDPHDNTFWFDERGKCIYLGYKNLNRIIKIDYPTKKVIATYGDTYKAGTKSIGGGIFCNLHAIKRSKDGYLYFFNNNSCAKTDSLPSVLVLKEPTGKNDGFTKVWEYTCVVEKSAPRQYASGGNALELADGSFFVNMGSDYSKLFIVNRDKKVLWSALPERYIQTESRWVPMKEYRVNMLSREDLVRLVWKAEE